MLGSPGSATENATGALRGDDNLGPVTDRTSQVVGRAVTASSRGVRGRHSTSDILSTSAPIGPGMYYDLGARGLPPSHLLYRLGAVLLLHHTIRTPSYPMIILDILSHYKHPMIQMRMLLLCLPVHSSSSSLLGPSRWTHLIAVLTMEPLIVAIPHLMLEQASRVDAKELSGCCIPALPPSRCTDHYIPWFLPRTHPRIQNPDRFPRGVQLPTTAPMTLYVLLDMISRELDRDDIDDATKVGRASDMIKKYHQTQR
ncbi:hypothetical protein M9H77_17063 [Catharanthus roseus]|uniref:Uncharacterized protein n=1 Tax=Catharanthus roseus TaxID=4058 RepID=A0ACC0B3H9_CATRO|nr:hypothetical protein M9H77_17063 [Catharanthus roseus]